MYLKKLILGLSFLATTQLSTAQNHVCGTHVTAQSLQNLIANKQSIKDSEARVMTRYIPVTFHLVADNNGDERLPYSAMLNQLCKMNKDYADLDMIFYLKDGGFNLINNNGIFFNPNIPTNINKIVDNKDDGSVNIFVTENADTGNGGPGTTLGFYTEFNDYVIVRKNELVDTSATISHEVGHFFSLNHPHAGWEDEPWTFEQYGSTVMITSINSSQTSGPLPVELVNGSNCEIAGDLVCDTPPDYNFGFTSPGCNFTYEVYDRNGDQIFPMVNNYMGYFNNCQKYEFTEEQGAIMKADFDSPRRAYLRSDYIPNLEPIVGPVVINSPANGESLESYNGVLLDWEPIANADKYLIELRAGSNILSYFSETDELFVTDLEPSTFYFWTVKPYNETSACVTSQSFLFQTGDVSSATQDIEGISEFKLYPNPNLGLQVSYLNFESTIATPVQIDIRDLSGKIALTDNRLINTGLNNIPINTTNLAKGTYLVSLKTENARMTRKLVIQ